MWSDMEEARPEPGVVAVVGLGKIGLPLAVQYASRGWRVLGCDSNPRVVESINAGRTHVHEEPELEKAVPELVARGLLCATLDTTEAVTRANVVVVVVPVQVDENQKVRFQELDAATAALGRGLRAGTLVIYETTLPVGTTAGRVRTTLEKDSHLDASSEFFLAYSPERVASGHIFRDLRVYPKVIGGINARSTQAAVAFYRSVLPAEIVSMSSCDEAEFVKLVETSYRDVNIALANEFASYADEHSLDVMAAIAAANTQPYSFVHQPGVGVGGHCIPVYPYFLLNNQGQGHNSSGLSLLRAARSINDGMAEYAVQRIEAAAGSLWRRSVLLLGVAYRGGVRETAFSSAYLLQAALWRRDATVYVDDPLYDPAELRARGFQPLPPGREDEIDAMILQASHQEYQSFDFQRFSRCRVLLDGRRGLARSRVEAASIRYMTLGDGADDAAVCMVQRG
jgi:nucleotide sugar dehydrogenase